MLKKMLKRVGTWTQACFMPLEMGKGSQLAVESHLAALVFMQLDHHLKELGGTAAKGLEDQPEAFPADGVKGLG